MCIKNEYADAEIYDCESFGFKCYVVKSHLSNGGVRTIFSVQLDDDLELEKY